MKENSKLIMIKEIRDKVTCTVGRFERTGFGARRYRKFSSFEEKSLKEDDFH